MSPEYPESEGAVENDCEDQGHSLIEEGCNHWPCNGTPLEKRPNHLGQGLWWICPQCGGSYGEAL